MSAVANYVSSIFIEGLVIGLVFWIIAYITIESTSLVGALRSSVVAETVGNTPYLWDLPGTSPPGILMSLVAAVIFVRLILRIGELTAIKATYGTAMTYFVLTALVTCSP